MWAEGETRCHVYSQTVNLMFWQQIGKEPDWQTKPHCLGHHPLPPLIHAYVRQPSHMVHITNPFLLCGSFRLRPNTEMRNTLLRWSWNLRGGTNFAPLRYNQLVAMKKKRNKNPSNKNTCGFRCKHAPAHTDRWTTLTWTVAYHYMGWLLYHHKNTFICSKAKLQIKAPSKRSQNVAVKPNFTVWIFLMFFVCLFVCRPAPLKDSDPAFAISEIFIYGLANVCTDIWKTQE